jgi:hypothetical protein
VLRQTSLEPGADRRVRFTFRLLGAAAWLCVVLCATSAGFVSDEPHVAPNAALTFADDERVSLRYECWFGPLRILEIATESRVTPVDYEIRVELRTVGMIGKLFPWLSISESSGRLDDPIREVRPVLYRVQSRYRSDTHRIEIRHTTDGSVVLTLEPPTWLGRLEHVPAEQQNGTVDPLSIMIALLRANAAQHAPPERWQMFDGARLVDLTLEDHGRAVMEPSKLLSAGGTARVFEATLQPVAGLFRKDSPTAREPVHVRYFLTTILPGVRPMPALIEMAGARGTLRADLVDARSGNTSRVLSLPRLEAELSAPH